MRNNIINNIFIYCLPPSYFLVASKAFEEAPWWVELVARSFMHSVTLSPINIIAAKIKGATIIALWANRFPASLKRYGLCNSSGNRPI